MEDYFELGYVKKSTGLKGVLIVQPETDRPEVYMEVDALFFDEGGQAVPYFPDLWNLDSNGQFRLHLEGHDDQASVKSLIGKKVFLPLSMLPPLKGKKFYYHEVIGWMAIDQNNNAIGKIKDIYDRGPQELLVVESSGPNDILLPMADQFLLEVNRDSKQLKLSIPEGLLEVYLSEQNSDEDS
jgi:16S rRNA processing protein RimM